MSISIVQTWPNHEDTGVPVGTTVQILFNTEVDFESVLNSVSMFGPDFDVVQGPGPATQVPKNKPEDILQSPGYRGELDFEIDVIRVDSNGDPVTEQFSIDSSLVEQHLVELKPKNLLVANTLYEVFVAGKAPGNDILGITKRSVFDPAANTNNTGTGDLLSAGIYTGNDPDILHIEVTQPGRERELMFDWWFDSDPVNIKSRKGSGLPLLLGRGVKVRFTGQSSDSFETGDRFSIQLVPVEELDNVYRFEFRTGPQELKEPNSTGSTSPIGTGQGHRVPTEKFKVIKITPENGASNVDTNTNQIIVEFNKPIDPFSLNNETIELLAQSADLSGNKRKVKYSYIVSGSRLFINITGV